MAKESQCHCASCLSVKQKWLAIGLFLISFLCSVWFLGLTFKDYNRFQLVPTDTGGEGTAAYKIDTKTGEVKGIYNLYEFNIFPFEETGPSASWSWGHRIQESTDLIYREEYLQ